MTRPATGETPALALFCCRRMWGEPYGSPHARRSAARHPWHGPVGPRLDAARPIAFPPPVMRCRSSVAIAGGLVGRRGRGWPGPGSLTSVRPLGLPFATHRPGKRQCGHRARPGAAAAGKNLSQVVLLSRAARRASRDGRVPPFFCEKSLPLPPLKRSQERSLDPRRAALIRNAS